MISNLLLLTLLPLSTTSICTPSTPSSSWPFDVSPTTAPSCVSSAGGVNDLGTAPTSCANDPASVYLELTPGTSECLSAKAFDCKIPMRNFTSLDYDFAIDSCMGAWAAPLWMTPDTWQWGGGSGEIDSLEFCARDGVNLNFAGGGNQISLESDEVDIDNSEGHVTVRKDEAGIVTITACSAEEAAGTGQCSAPAYASCTECLASETYACWCSEGTANIYDSGGCVDGTDCLWTLVSDIWNGVDGDDG